MTHHKTTIGGIVLGGLMAAQPVIENGDFDIKRDWLKLTISVGVFVLGLFAHDPRKKI